MSKALAKNRRDSERSIPAVRWALREQTLRRFGPLRMRPKRRG